MQGSFYRSQCFKLLHVNPRVRQQVLLLVHHVLLPPALALLVPDLFSLRFLGVPVVQGLRWGDRIARTLIPAVFLIILLLAAEAVILRDRVPKIVEGVLFRPIIRRVSPRTVVGIITIATRAGIMGVETLDVVEIIILAMTDVRIPMSSRIMRDLMAVGALLQNPSVRPSFFSVRERWL